LDKIQCESCKSVVLLPKLIVVLDISTSVTISVDTLNDLCIPVKVKDEDGKSDFIIKEILCPVCQTNLFDSGEEKTVILGGASLLLSEVRRQLKRVYNEQGTKKKRRTKEEC
jgi:hypothetical protein